MKRDTPKAQTPKRLNAQRLKGGKTTSQAAVLGVRGAVQPASGVWAAHSRQCGTLQQTRRRQAAPWRHSTPETHPHTHGPHVGRPSHRRRP